jgi:hypothetical protein
VDFEWLCAVPLPGKLIWDAVQLLIVYQSVLRCRAKSTTEITLLGPAVCVACSAYFRVTKQDVGAQLRRVGVAVVTTSRRVLARCAALFVADAFYLTRAVQNVGLLDCCF